MGGAKNHGIVMPDADLDAVVNDLAGAAFGSAGERCMALPIVVPVGDETADRLREKLLPAIANLRVGVSSDPQAQYGPVVTAKHKARIEAWIQKSVDEGGEMEIGREHVCTPVNNAHSVCRLQLEKKKETKDGII